ncbi:MAG: flagellar basal body-associated FliL family protein [Zetaproteobacteria bacterium]|nr:flagellar basal body-associated FliL family protein [Zetaproteobacteria bacterium]
MADKEEKKEEKKSGGGLLTIILLVLVVVSLGVGGFAVFKMMEMNDALVTLQEQKANDTSGVEGGSFAGGMPKPIVETPGQQIDIEPLTVNLSDSDGTRYLRIKMKFEIPSDLSSDVLSPYMGVIKDLLINVLSSKTSDQLRSPQGKYQLKEELKYRVNDIVAQDSPVVRKIYFGEFIIQ